MKGRLASPLAIGDEAIAFHNTGPLLSSLSSLLLCLSYTLPSWPPTSPPPLHLFNDLVFEVVDKGCPNMKLLP
ncbi:hypothetical protein KY285_011077 [Solanum tuberosum]|nr:hypothetical protein KY289_011632 [Solanum tuberosum]KAH0735370.1 hypothetical protein KY285_011077 [Solanum tuberosum]